MNLHALRALAERVWRTFGTGQALRAIALVGYGARARLYHGAPGATAFWDEALSVGAIGIIVAGLGLFVFLRNRRRTKRPDE